MREKLDLCPFCQTKLYIDPHFNFKCLDCPNVKHHSLKNIWAFYFDSDRDFNSISLNRISSLNIKLNDYQLHFSFKDNLTFLYKLINYDVEDDYSTEIVVQFPYILNLELTEIAIDNKIKSILTFR